MKATAFALSLVLTTAAFAQTGTLVFRESFGFGVNGMRPKSGKGKLVSIFAGTGVGGFWAEFPADRNTSWNSLDVTGVPGWNFAATSDNLNEAPSPLQQTYGNGTAWCFNDLGAFRSIDLLAPVSSPRVKFSISADLMPRPIPGHYTALGMTSSGALEDNFEGGAKVWVRILAPGVAEFRTNGMTGPSTTVQVPVTFNGFNPVEITVDPVALTATATVNGVPMGTLPIPAGTTKYVGVEGSGGVDNFLVVLK